MSVLCIEMLQFQKQSLFKAIHTIYALTTCVVPSLLSGCAAHLYKRRITAHLEVPASRK